MNLKKLGALPAAMPSVGKTNSAEAVDVVVVGGGVSGLVCAAALRRRAPQLGVRLLEARSRLGGRVLATAAGTDLGGSWTWPSETRVAALAAELGVRPAPQNVAGAAFAVDARSGRATNLGDCGDRFAPCGAGALRAHFPEMARRLADRAGGDATVRLGWEVQSVVAEDADHHHTPNNALLRVTARRREKEEGEETLLEVRCRRVVMALPPRVMAETVRFDPALPAEHMAKCRRTATWCGDWCKLALECRSPPFWRDAAASGVALTQVNGADVVWWEGADAALVGLAAGSRETRRAFGALDKNALRRAAADALRPAFPDIDSHILDCHCQLWADEDLTFGPADAPEPAERDYGAAVLRKPTPAGVHFAGTETERCYGHVEGAILAGERAADEVLAAIL